MAHQKTFGIIKPDAVKGNHIGSILKAIADEGLILTGLQMVFLTPEMCKSFYHEHVTKGFYKELEDFMTEGAVVLMQLEGDDAINRWRNLMGSTNPAMAAEGTLRKRFGSSIGRNATHGSDSEKSASFEIDFFFPN